MTDAPLADQINEASTRVVGEISFPKKCGRHSSLLKLASIELGVHSVSSQRKKMKMFPGVTPGAKIGAYLSIVLLLLGLILVAGLGLSAAGESPAILGALLVWVLGAAVRVGVSTRAREFSAMLEIMKWQTAVGAAAAAIAVPVAIGSAGGLAQHEVPIALFLMAAVLSGLGIMFSREAVVQMADNEAEAERWRNARTIAKLKRDIPPEIGREVAGALAERAPLKTSLLRRVFG